LRTTIQIHGARENNLQNIDVEIPRDKLVVVTGMLSQDHRAGG